MAMLCGECSTSCDMSKGVCTSCGCPLPTFSDGSTGEVRTFAVVSFGLGVVALSILYPTLYCWFPLIPVWAIPFFGGGFSAASGVMNLIEYRRRKTHIAKLGMIISGIGFLLSVGLGIVACITAMKE